jgi:hypothetical protein
MEQNYSNHPRLVKPFHGLLFLLLLVGLAGSVVNLVKSLESDQLYSASLLVLLFVICSLISWYTRSFPLKAQDRAIRSEENLRHFILTGKLLPEGLKMGQIVALRFAPDEEFPGLTERSVRENLSGKKIKLAIKKWKPDHYRV